MLLVVYTISTKLRSSFPQHIYTHISTAVIIASFKLFPKSSPNVINERRKLMAEKRKFIKIRNFFWDL